MQREQIRNLENRLSYPIRHRQTEQPIKGASGDDAPQGTGALPADPVQQAQSSRPIFELLNYPNEESGAGREGRPDVPALGEGDCDPSTSRGHLMTWEQGLRVRPDGRCGDPSDNKDKRGREDMLEVLHLEVA